MSTPSVSRPLPFSQPAAGATPTPTTTASQASRSPPVITSSSTVPLPLADSSIVAEAHVDALVGVQLGEPAADLLAEDVGEGRGKSLDDRDLGPGLAGGRGDLLADEAGADDRQAGARLELGAQPPGVGEGAQVVDVRVALQRRQGAAALPVAIRSFS